VLTLPLADGRELEVTAEKAGRLRIALYRRYGKIRMCEGGFSATRAEVALLNMALERTTLPEAA
jgi:hypothetical protein